MQLKKIICLMAILFSVSIANAQQTTPPTEPVPIVTESTTNSTVTTTSETNLKSPPPSAISPSISTSNSDLCTFGVAGAIQTQILGLSRGTQIRDMNCEMLKNAKTLYDMGMKVAAVSIMCQDRRVFDAMMNAGTPCPYDGLIGREAKAAWEANVISQPGIEKESKGFSNETKTLFGIGGVVSLLILLLL